MVYSHVALSAGLIKSEVWRLSSKRGPAIGFSDPAKFFLLILPSHPTLRQNPDPAQSLK